MSLFLLPRNNNVFDHVMHPPTWCTFCRNPQPSKLALTPLASQTQTLSSAKRRLKRSKDNVWQLEWQSSSLSGATQTYWELELSPITRANALKELSFKRKVLGWLIVARSGHGHFAAYHKRFGHKEETDLYCICGQKRAQLHLFSCPNARAHRALL